MQRRAYGSGGFVVERGKLYVKGRDASGRQRRRVIGPEGMPKREAERALRAFLEELAGSTPPPQAPAVFDLAQAGTRYLDHLTAVGRKQTTLTDYRSYLRVHLAEAVEFKGRALGRLTVEDVERFQARKLRDGAAAKSVTNWVGLLSSILGYGVRKGWLRENVAAKAERPRVERSDDLHYLDATEFEALLRAASDDLLGPTDRLIWLAAGMTGARRGELLGLRWRDIDWEHRSIRVRRSFTRVGGMDTPKSRKGRAVPMGDRLAAELERHYQANASRGTYVGDDDLVFCHPGTGNVYDPSKLYKRFKAALRRAGVRDVAFHDLRHTFATTLASRGAPMRAIQAWMGHADLRTTLVYADYAADPSEGAAWVDRAFAPRTNPRTNLDAPRCTSEHLEAPR